jgi:hypothetical protein
MYNSPVLGCRTCVVTGCIYLAAIPAAAVARPDQGANDDNDGSTNEKYMHSDSTTCRSILWCFFFFILGFF